MNSVEKETNEKLSNPNFSFEEKADSLNVETSLESWEVEKKGNDFEVKRDIRNIGGNFTGRLSVLSR